jgi:hypothetical protein
VHLANHVNIELHVHIHTLREKTYLHTLGVSPFGCQE